MAATAAATAMPVAPRRMVEMRVDVDVVVGDLGALHHLEHRAHVLDAAVRHSWMPWPRMRAPRNARAQARRRLDRTTTPAGSPTSPYRCWPIVRLAHHRAFHAEVEAREAPLDLLRRDLLFELRLAFFARRTCSMVANSARSARKVAGGAHETAQFAKPQRELPVSPLRRCARRTSRRRGKPRTGDASRPDDFLGDELQELQAVLVVSMMWFTNTSTRTHGYATVAPDGMPVSPVTIRRGLHASGFPAATRMNRQARPASWTWRLRRMGTDDDGGTFPPEGLKRPAG